MSKMNRRSFIGVTAAGAAALSYTGCARRSTLDHASLVHVGEAVLPDELGAEGAQRIADDFIAWLSGFVAGAELNHAYGSGELMFTQGLPVSLWAEQLEQLNTLARERFARGLSDTTKDERRSLIRDVLEEFPEAQLTDPARAQHVAVALLSFYYETPEATDLAYRVSIKKQQCRPLSDVRDQPIALG